MLFYWNEQPDFHLDARVVADAIARSCDVGPMTCKDKLIVLDGLAAAYNAPMQPMLMFSSMWEVEDKAGLLSPLESGQLWRIKGREEEVLATMNYAMGMTEMFTAIMAGDYPPLLRLSIYAAAIHAMVSTYSPDVVHVLHCGDLYDAAELIRSMDESRFSPLNLACTVRAFNIAGSEQDEFVMDSLGLFLFGLPDVQVHAHSVDRGEVESDIWSLAHYLLDNGDVIENGDTVGEHHYRCQHENALIGPPREVLDINIGAYAAGNRAAPTEDPGA